MVLWVASSMHATTYKFPLGLQTEAGPTGPNGHAFRILLHKFPIPLGRVAKLLWPWHTPCRIQALTQGQAGYW